MSGKTILVLGAGIGGVVVARRLRRALPRAHRVVLVERNPQLLYQPSLLWLMLGWRRPDRIARPLAGLARRGIEIVRGEIERIDPARRAVAVAGREWPADYLVIALGAELAPQAIPGLAEAGHNLYTLAGAAALRDARAQFRGGRLAVLIGGVPFKCPAAPYEAALLLEHDFRRRGLRATVSLDIYTPEPGPMPVAGAEVSQQVRQLVEARGIAYHPGHSVTRVDGGAHRLHFADGTEAGYDLLAYVPPHRVPPVVQAAGLAAAGGWVEVDRATLATRFPGVYALGDVTGIPLAIGKPLPKAGVFAHGEAEVVAHNLTAEITGRGTARRYGGEGACFVETGDGRAGHGAGHFFAEPAPRVRLAPPSRGWRLAKLWYEKYWLWRWF